MAKTIKKQEQEILFLCVHKFIFKAILLIISLFMLYIFKTKLSVLLNETTIEYKVFFLGLVTFSSYSICIFFSSLSKDLFVVYMLAIISLLSVDIYIRQIHILPKIEQFRVLPIDSVKNQINQILKEDDSRAVLKWIA